MKRITASTLTKIIGISCVVYVFLAMVLRGTLSIIIGLCILLPMALFDRYLIQKEEKETSEFLKRYFAECGYVGICYQGYDSLNEKDVTLTLFRRKGIDIFKVDSKANIERLFSIDKENIKDARQLNLAEVKEISSTSQYDTLGKLGRHFYTETDKSKIRKRKKDKSVNYLFIRFINSKGKISTISIYSNTSFADYNRRLTIEESINKFSEDNY
ncbi:MAG: hypothetical protein ACI4WG_02185 [Erysipelotrichaceae bacterium]